MIKRGMESRKKTESAVIQPANGIIKRLEFCGNARNQKLTKQKNHAIIKKYLIVDFFFSSAAKGASINAIRIDITGRYGSSFPSGR